MNNHQVQGRSLATGSADMPRERQAFHRAHTTLGVGHWLKTIGILSPLIIGEFVKDPEGRWRYARIGAVATARPFRRDCTRTGYKKSGRRETNVGSVKPAALTFSATGAGMAYRRHVHSHRNRQAQCHRPGSLSPGRHRLYRPAAHPQNTRTPPLEHHSIVDTAVNTGRSRTTATRRPYI